MSASDVSVRLATPPVALARFSVAIILVLLFSISLFGVNLPGSRVAIGSGAVLAAIIPFIWVNLLSLVFLRAFSLNSADLTAAAFAAFTLIALLLSALQFFPELPDRPYRPDYLLRQAFYVFLLGPTLMTSALMGVFAYDFVMRLVGRWGLMAYGAIGVIDVSWALLFGDPQGLTNEGYLAALDPSTTSFLCVASYFGYCAASRKRGLPIAIAFVYFFASVMLDAGMMYNTLTGKYILLMQIGFTALAGRGPILPLVWCVLITCCVAFVLVVGMSVPSLAQGELNTAWRFNVWRDNMKAMLDSAGFGIGFGRPYYAISPNNVSSVYRLAGSNEFSAYRQTSVFDILYVRAQHSSVVNTFYRMGFVGGMLLLAMYVEIVRLSLRRIRDLPVEQARLLSALVVLFLAEAMQTALHVGLESPRYFIFLCLSWGLLRGALAHVPPTERAE